MTDREKVIYDIERCICHVPDACRDYSHYGHGEVIGCMEELLTDALALLKEQEAVEPISYHRSDGTIFKHECRKCRTKIFKMDLFCRHCGQAVKWE